MPVELSNVPGRAEPEGFVHVGVATGSRTVYLAGQVSQDAEGATVAKGDLAGQTEQALLNVASALESVGASFDDVAKVTDRREGAVRPRLPDRDRRDRRAGLAKVL
jgi:enamine deaminase RidA (YjgF/YER057c/UK114 family)